ncbi:hypothetical protein [Rhizobium sp. BK251]|uniref:hypothetical protein n=1 Tax=Rhizobium sp. BK251 TaxID=2512125 RepID=UPI001053D0EB|nr:hypothetical protein [Rhizobium sp. BK251]TCL70598.1 hypothetical protein EV286_107475 [Rhizobium sp. BK251]
MSYAELCRRLRELLTMSMFRNSSDLFEALNQQRAEAADAIQDLSAKLAEANSDRCYHDDEDPACKLEYAFTNQITSLTARAEKAEAALRDAKPEIQQWCAHENGSQCTSWYPEGYGDRAGWDALAKRSPDKYQIVTRPLYVLPALSAIGEA